MGGSSLPWVDGGTPYRVHEPTPSLTPWWAVPMLPDNVLAALFPEVEMVCVVCGSALPKARRLYCSQACQHVAAVRRRGQVDQGDDDRSDDDEGGVAA